MNLLDLQNMVVAHETEDTNEQNLDQDISIVCDESNLSLLICE